MQRWEVAKAKMRMCKGAKAKVRRCVAKRKDAKAKGLGGWVLLSLLLLCNFTLSFLHLRTRPNVYLWELLIMLTIKMASANIKHENLG